MSPAAKTSSLRREGGLRGAPTREAVFVDLDRTLLRGASCLVLGSAMEAEGLLVGRPSIPGEQHFYSLYDAAGENLPFVAMARAAARLVKGWSVESVRRAGAMAASHLSELVQPHAPSVLAEHRNAGRLLVLATTSPLDLVEPFAKLFGFDDLIATEHAHRDGRYTGGIEGEFVWSRGKRAAVVRWAADHAVDLRACHAYSDSVFDLPLLTAVGHPHAVRPDPSLWLVARARRWPIEHWDRPPGVPAVAGFQMYHLLRPVARPAMFPYARFEISGTEHVPVTGPVLLVSNHRSYFDVVALALMVARLGRPIRFLGKKELFDAPVIGQLARACGGISVDRASEASRSLVEARRALDAGEIVVILPQGTIPRGKELFDRVLHGKTGTARLAAATGAPVVPVGLWGTERVWPRSGLVPNVTNLLHPPKVVVRVGPPVPLALALSDAVVDTEAIMSAIRDLLPADARTAPDPSSEELARITPP